MVGMVMRVCIIGIDGLEYNLVRKWKLRGLMQKRYGYFIVTDEYFNKEGVPYTPKVWATVISGIKPKEHKVSGFYSWGKVLDLIRRAPIVRHIKGKRFLAYKLGLKPKASRVSNSLFDLTEDAIAVYVPGYNDVLKVYLTILKSFKGGMFLKEGLNEYVKTIWRIHKLRKKRTFEEIKKDWKLFMTYFDLLDLLGHLYYVKYPKKLRIAYMEMDRVVEKIRRIVPEDTVILILSDHGMEESPDSITGNHSGRAFWSINIDTEWRPEDFTDIYKAVVRWLGSS